MPLFVPPVRRRVELDAPVVGQRRRGATPSRRSPAACAPAGSPSANRQPAPKSCCGRCAALRRGRRDQAPIATTASTTERTAIRLDTATPPEASIPCAGLYPRGAGLSTSKVDAPLRTRGAARRHCRVCRWPSAPPRPLRNATRPSSQSRTDTWCSECSPVRSSRRSSPSSPKRSATTLCWWIVSRFSWRARTKEFVEQLAERLDDAAHHLAHAVLDEARPAVGLLDHRALVGALHQLVDLRRHRALDDGQQRLGVDVVVALLGAADVERAQAALVVGGDGHRVEDALDLARRRSRPRAGARATCP